MLGIKVNPCFLKGAQDISGQNINPLKAVQQLAFIRKLQAYFPRQIEIWTNIANILQITFEIYFLKWKWLYFD